MSGAARRAQIQWHADLRHGQGAARALPSTLRAVLMEATAMEADAQVRALDMRRAAASRANDRHDGKAAARSFGRTIAIAFAFWILTPIVASFGTIVVPAMSTAVFVASENDGRSEGDAPVMLYTHLAVTLALFCAAILALNLLFGMRARFSWIVWLGGIGGFAFAAWLLADLGGAMWQWDITPIALVCAYAVAQVCTTVADLRKSARAVLRGAI